MRHGKKINHLSRTKPHRQAMLSNMACSLIQHKRINTTLAKAKALRGFVEPLITKSKNDNTHSRRVVFSYLNDKFAVSELFREVAPKVADRPGGYTRIIKTGNRMGDNAEMCMMELVDFNELYTSDVETGAKKSRRRRKSGSSASDAPKAEAPKEVKAEVKTPEAKTEAPVDVKEETPAKEETKAETTTDEANTSEETESDTEKKD